MSSWIGRVFVIFGSFLHNIALNFYKIHRKKNIGLQTNRNIRKNSEGIKIALRETLLVAFITKKQSTNIKVVKK